MQSDCRKFSCRHTAAWFVVAGAATGLIGCDANRQNQPEQHIQVQIKPKVSYAVKRGELRHMTKWGLTPELRHMTWDTSSIAHEAGELKLGARVPGELSTSGAQGPDPVAQRAITPNQMPEAQTNFEGNGNLDNQDVLGFKLQPPDPTGDVGPSHYVQWINLVFSVFDKQGNEVFGPAPGNLFWQGFGGPCESNNDGDIIVLYDHLADRWVFSQFAVTGDGHQCFAVSQTGDPLGAYNLYDYVLSPGGINDYPKIGLWPDGYYLTFNNFVGFGFDSAVAVAFDREAMVQGLPAAAVRFAIRDDTAVEMYFAVQPPHLEGLGAPAAGAPAPFVMAFDDEIWGPGGTPDSDTYKFWEFSVDWTDPGAATFSGPINVPTADFDGELCGFDRNCIVQPDTPQRLDSLGQFTMYRAAYREFEGHSAMTLVHTVDIDGQSTAGVRWAEVRNPGIEAYVHQTGTFGPADGDSRWMPSAAQDAAGNLAVGYSVSGPDTYPSVRYAGRLVNDPLGELSQGEGEFVAGTGSQTDGNRWGDYAAMGVDELDGCTFWFTGEYYADGAWRTRVGSFSFPTCISSEIGTVRGNVTAAAGGPIQGAKVKLGNLSTVTNADGNYSVLVPADTYDLVVSAFGYESQVVPGLVVADGDVIELDFVLEEAEVVTMDGFIYDAVIGWPLYAELEFTAPGAPPMKTFSDPETGYYSIELLSGLEYNATVTSLVPGYFAETRPIMGGPGDIVAHFGLDVNIGTCEAPAYTRTIVTELLFEGFEGEFPPADWTVENDTTGCDAVPGWTNTDPGNRGNLTGGAGKFASVDSDVCGSFVAMSARLITAPFDLSNLAPNEGVMVSFDTDYYDIGSTATVDVFDGSNWQVAVDFSGASRRGPTSVEFGTDVANGLRDARLRWRYEAGWDWWWQIDDVRVVKTSCDYLGGGLVIGQVTDTNTGAAVAGATVSVDGVEAAKSIATPDDPDVGDGFYTVFLSQPSVVSVGMSGYGSAEQSVIPQFNGVRRVDFDLPAGLLEINPAAVWTRVPFDQNTNVLVTIANSGGADAWFALWPVEGPAAQYPFGPFAPTGRRTSPKKLSWPDATAVRVAFDTPDAPVLANAGDVLARYAAPAGAWGIGLNTQHNDGWVGSISYSRQGDDQLHRMLSDGSLTGEAIPVTEYAQVFSADMAYNIRTGTLWQVNVGGDDCVHEVDPVNQQVTGATICPAFGTSERGLAYDAVTDTYFAGSWNDGVIKQFDPNGVIIRSVAVGLDIAGLAYNAGTQHLFVLTNSATAQSLDVYVLDVNADFAIVGSFELTENGQPAFADFGQAALDIDCNGNLWAVDQIRSEVVVATSGETGSCGIGSLPWLTIDPAEGIVAPNSALDITLGFIGEDVVPGQRQAQLVVSSNTPYDSPSVPVFLTVAFLDVTADHPDDAYIHALSSAGVTAGCGAGNFCPEEGLRRAQMAVWLLRTIYGPDFSPPSATGLIFDDVSPESYAADFIEELARQGYYLGCGGNYYCPNAVLLREEAAVFVLRAIEGADYTPPPAEGIFDDVPDDPFRAWIDEFARRGIATECGPNLFCPDEDATRAQMAVFLVRGFGLPVFVP